MPILSTHSITHSFEKIQALNDVSISVTKGEMFGLVGPDGSGKTTLIRIILGIIDPNKGEVFLFDENRKSNPNLVKNRVGYLSQQFSLYEYLSIDENIEFFASIHNLTDFNERRNELLAFTRLTPFRDRLAGKLSGGMKQKLALACTLIHKPDIIFLDEPTTGVDPISRRDFWKILSDLLKQGLTIFLTTPYMDEAERCNRVALINKGNVLTTNTPEKLKNEMGFSILEVIPDDPRKSAQKLKEKIIAENVQLFGERLQILFNPAEMSEKEILDFFTENKIGYHSERVMKPTMENVFIYYMNKSNG